ncbi:hypothetical protein Tco_1147752 [Tanacetum coccineum]
MVVETKLASKDVNLSVDEVTLAQALAALKSAKPKADNVMLQEPEQGTITTTTAPITIIAASTRLKAKGLIIHEKEQAPTPTVSSQQPSQLNVQDKGKGKMVELEPVKKLLKKDQLILDEELAFKLQAEEEEEDRLVRQREEKANIVSWDNVQAMIDADYQMAQQMQAEEQEKLSIEEKSKLFVQLLEARKKHFAAIRAKEKRNTPPTKAQNMDTELVEGSEVRAEGSETRTEGSSKRAGEDLQQESIKKQKVDWKNHKEGRKAIINIRLMEVQKDVLRLLTTSNALVSCDGSGYDWSDQAEEGPTNFALMAYPSTTSNSKVSTDSNYSSSCLKNVKILKEQNEQLLKDIRTSKFNAIAYKTCLESIEARLLVYKKNEFVFEEDIKVLKRKIHLREVAITKLRRKLELAQKQKDKIQLIVENFENSSKNLSKLIDCQIIDKYKTGLGYNVVPPPYTGNFMPPKPDLSFSGLEEFTSEPIVIKPVGENSEAKASEAKPKEVRKNNGAPIINDWVSDNEEDDVPQAKIEKKTFNPSFAKIEFVKPKQQEMTARKTVHHVEQNRQNIHTPRGNQRN